MAGVNTQVKVTDGMSKVLQRMNKALNLVIDSFNELQDVSNSSINTSNIEEARQELQRAAEEAYNLEEGMNDAGNAIEKANGGFTIMKGIISNLAANNISNNISNLTNSLVKMSQECVDAFDTEIFAKNQLRAVLANMVGDQYEEAYASIAKKADEIQARGMYGNEAMLAGAAEFATYFEDTKAIEVMMDTLADYVAGMTGGGEVGSTAMTDYATGLGKIMTGSYEAMTKKGFKFTETQKAIIEGTATEAEIVKTLGEEYLNAGHEMQAAMTIQQVIGESWKNLYGVMSETPRGEIISLKNTIGDIKETVAARLYPSILTLVEYLTNNMPKIEKLFDGLVTILNIVLSLTIGLIEFIGDNSTVIEAFAASIGIVSAALLAYKGYLYLATYQQLLLNAAMDACPIIAIISLITMAIMAVINWAKSVGDADLAWMIACHNILTIMETIAVAAVELIQTVSNALIWTANALTGWLLDLQYLDFADEFSDSVSQDWVDREKEIDKKKAELAKMSEEQQNVMDDYLAKLNIDDISTDVDDIVQNTGDTAKALEITDEDLKYLRDIAEQEAINRFTTAEIKIDMQNNNNISSDMDIDGIVSTLEDRLYESMTIAAEGAY